MSCLGPGYEPKPPRIWSRVENPCAYFSNFTGKVVSPFTGELVTLEEADSYEKIQYKGNILQYKKNSSNLTQKQKYSQICKGMWTNRTKTWATQGQNTTNPNTHSYSRSNAGVVVIPTGNAPAGSSANYYNPFDCSANMFPTTIPDGGTLLGTTTVAPCSGVVIKKTQTINCNLGSCSDVPGQPVVLCWNPNFQTYYPKRRLTMSNSGNKFPVNYKFLVSANSIPAHNKLNNY